MVHKTYLQPENENKTLSMKASTKQVCWSFYVLGLGMLLLGLFGGLTTGLTLITMGATFLFFPWAICIISIFNMQGDRMLWAALMIMLNVIAIPVFLMKKDYKTINT